MSSSNSGSGSSSSSSGRDEFARAVAKTAVAQICESVGFHSFQASAIETLADIAIRYLRDLAKAAHYYSNLAGRIESNAFDVILAMEDVGPAGSAADASRPLSSSNAIREVMRYVEYGEEIPFSRPLPRFPVAKKRSAAPSFAQLGETPPGSHIPSWLPALPDPHTYRSTPQWPDRKRDPAADRMEQARQRRKAENSLVALHSRLSSSTGATTSDHPRISSFGLIPSASKEQADVIAKMESEGKAAVTAQSVYLAPPLPAGAKEVSPVTFASSKAKDVVENGTSLPSAVEAFASVLDSADNVEVQEGSVAPKELQKKRVLPDFKDRPRVTFDFGGKVHAKGLSAHVILGVDNQLPRKHRGRVSMEEDKDERKRRAEQILAQAIEGTDLNAV